MSCIERSRDVWDTAGTLVRFVYALDDRIRELCAQAFGKSRDFYEQGYQQLRPS